MTIKKRIVTTHCLVILLSLLSACYASATDHPQRNCIILVDHNDDENIGNGTFYLMSRIQSAIAEQSTPLLMSTSLWNTFIERRIRFEQSLQQKNNPLYRIHKLYQAINKKMEELSHQHNELSADIAHNKKLIIQSINTQFYNHKKEFSLIQYQLLVNHFTLFDPQSWDIYQDNGGFFLLIPKNYNEQYAQTGFNIDNLEKITYPEDNSFIYFQSRNKSSLIDALPQFFLTHDDCDDSSMPYAWNILLEGHGGWQYTEKNDNQTITWKGEPLIASLTAQELDAFLTFFQSQVKTNLIYYTSCYAGGNHASLIFNDKQKDPYNFTLICATLTDCTSYCKWTELLPSAQKTFLTTADIVYDTTKNCWQLSSSPVYHWAKFFKSIESVDFSAGSLEQLESALNLINNQKISNIPLVCLAGSKKFFPLQRADVIKIDDQLIALAQTEDDDIALNGIRTVLLESTCVIPTIQLNHYNPLRIISIKPGDAVHYIKNLESPYYLDLPSVFWQAHYQLYKKTFIIDECTFPYSYSLKDIIAPQEDDLVFKNVMIIQHSYSHMRIFGTLNDKAMMIIAHKTAEEDSQAKILEVVPMTKAGREKYEETYLALKTAALNNATTND